MFERDKILDGKEIVWLASYPKSGNTWVREIVSQMFFSGMNRMEAIPTYHSQPPTTFAEIERNGKSCAIAKTHLKSSHDNIKKLSNVTNGVIIIKRHPFDVLLSTLNFARIEKAEVVFLNNKIKTVEEIISDNEIGHYIEQFCDLGCSPWFKVATGNIAEFVSGWKNSLPEQNVLELAYEELLSDPHANAKKVSSFFNQDLSDDEIKKSLEESDKKTAKNGTFFWKRRSYNFENMVKEEHIDQFNRAGALLLSELGYDTR